MRGAAFRGSFLVTLGKGLGQEEFSYLGVVTLDRGLAHFSWSGRDLAERGYFLRVGERESFGCVCFSPPATYDQDDDQE